MGLGRQHLRQLRRRGLLTGWSISVAVAVVLGLSAAERSGLATTDPAATASALAKVSRVLPRALSQRLDSLLSTAQFTTPVSATAPAGVDTLLGLTSAAQARRTVVIAYTTWAGRESQRGLDVYGVVFHSGRWYVTGRDHDRDDVRTFRLDRIASVTQGDGTYVVPADFDATTQVVSDAAPATPAAKLSAFGPHHRLGSGSG